MAASEQDIRNFFAAYDRDFNGLCEAAMFQTIDRFGSPESPRSFLTAVKAGDASQPLAALDRDAVGWFGFWGPPTGGAAGHTALIMPGRRWLMGSARVTDKIGGKSRNVGFIPIDEYTLAGFRGIARVSGGRTIDIVGQTPLPAAAAQDWSYWEPPKGTGLVARVQEGMAARKDRNGRKRYTGRIDDESGELTRKAIQETLAISGMFKGDIDGRIERGGCYGFQDYGIKYGGYLQLGGKRDGKLGRISWDAFGRGVNP